MEKKYIVSHFLLKFTLEDLSPRHIFINIERPWPFSAKANTIVLFVKSNDGRSIELKPF